MVSWGTNCSFPRLLNITCGDLLPSPLPLSPTGRGKGEGDLWRYFLQRLGRLALLHFCEKLRGSDPSESQEGRGDSGALRGTTRRWSFHGSGRGRRPSASLCGKALGIADESGIPGRCFRESRRHPRAQSKRSSQKQWFKVKGGKAPKDS